MEDGYIASFAWLPLVDDCISCHIFHRLLSTYLFYFDDETSHARARRYTIHLRDLVRSQAPSGPAYDTMSQMITYNDRDIPHHIIANSDIG